MSQIAVLFAIFTLFGVPAYLYIRYQEAFHEVFEYMERRYATVEDGGAGAEEDVHVEEEPIALDPRVQTQLRKAWLLLVCGMLFVMFLGAALDDLYVSQIDYTRQTEAELMAKRALNEV
ncbi:unnamed protein product [Caenorhabditis brenneri]